MTTEDIMAEIGVRFRTFGGGVSTDDTNPISVALKDEPLQFAAGVDVREVVEFVKAAALADAAQRGAFKR